MPPTLRAAWQAVRQLLGRAPFALVLSAWSILLAVLLTWPTALELNQGVLGSPHADGIKHLWTLWWMRQELLVQHQIPWDTQYVNFPQGMQLYPIEPLNGLLVTLLGFLPLVAATNLVALLNLSATGLAGGLLGKELSGSKWGGAVAGTLLQGSAMALFTIQVGVGELQHLWWLPLGGWAWLKLREGLGWRATFGLAGCLAGATLSCFYHGFFLATAIAVLSLSTLWAGRRTPALLARYGVAAGLGLLVVLPVVLSFSGSYGSGDIPQVGLLNYISAEHGQPVTDPFSARLELSELWTPRRGQRADASMELLGYGGGRYLGWVALLMGLGGAIRAPKKALPWVLVGVVGVGLALGSFWGWGEEEGLTASGARIRLPFFWLNRALGYVSEPLNFPVRFLAVTVTALSACAALLTQRLKQPAWIFALALLAVLDVQRHQLIGRPLPTFAPWDFSVLEGLSEGEHPTVDLTLAWRADKEVRFAGLSAQMEHGQAIQAVPLERIEFFATDGRDAVGVLPLVQKVGEGFIRVDTDTSSVDVRRDVSLLRAMGFERVMVLGVGQNRQVSPRVRLDLKKLLGEPILDEPQALVFELPIFEISPDELAQWQAEHAEQVRALQQNHTQPGPQLH